MARDSLEWEKAYNAYKKVHKTHKVPVYSKKPRNITKEPMVLQSELKIVNNKIKVLTKRREYLMRCIEKSGGTILTDKYLSKPIFLYALQLGNGFYYVGMTRDVHSRLRQHEKGKGSMWSKQYGVVRMFDIRQTGLTIDSLAAKLEDDMTIEYALKYGSDKVRGGGYCQRKPRWPDVVRQNELERTW